MTRRPGLGLPLAALLVLPAFGQMPTAAEILSKAKQAMGGEAWDRIRTTHTKGKFKAGGLMGEGESWEDALRGRFVTRYRLGPASGAEGFDGTEVWSQDSSGQPRPEGGDDARQGAIDEAYRISFAYWFPQRWAAEVEYSGQKEENGKAFQVLRITPKGGRVFELWIDAASYVFDHTLEKQAIETRTSYFSDYRTVDGVKVPFALRSTNGNTKYDQVITVDTIEFNQPVEQAQFRMPAPPAPDFGITGGKTSTTVPFELINNHIYVHVKLDGKGPFQMLCDTGGANIVTPALAKELGLKPEGALEGRGVGEKSEDVGLAKVERVEVGNATLSNQLFAIYPMESLASVEGVTESGLIGYEVFKRFVVKIDYEHSELTLTAPAAFRYDGHGTVVPFQFNDHIPQVDGEIDGVAGKFDIDTGSRSSVSVLKPFAEQHDLKAHYGAEVEAVTGWGIGGAARSLLTRAKVLRLGTVEVTNPVTELSLQQKGAFSSPYVAGNVGGGVLKRFNITFDYPHRRMIFERNANYDMADVFDRSGMWVNLAGGALEVVDVIAGGPAAAAGLKVGDKIESINGRPVSELTLPAVRRGFKSDAPGTKVQMRVESAGSVRELEIVLRDLV